MQRTYEPIELRLLGPKETPQYVASLSQDSQKCFFMDA